MNLIARLLPVLKSEFEKKRGGNHERQDFEDTTGNHRSRPEGKIKLQTNGKLLSLNRRASYKEFFSGH